METLNYESALDKFSSVSSFKEDPLPPPSPEKLGDSGGGGSAARAEGLTAASLEPCVIGKVRGPCFQRTTPRIRAVKVCLQTKEKESYETTIMDCK